MNALELVVAERAKQIEKWGNDHDDKHTEGELAMVAEDLLYDGTDAKDRWGILKKHGGNRIKILTIAAELVIAELEREIRAAERAGKKE